MINRFLSLMEFKFEYDDIEETFNEIIHEFMNDTYEKINPFSDLKIHTQAVQDFQDAIKVARGMKNGKATTPWGIPSEIWKIILNPNKVFKNTDMVLDTKKNSPYQ